MKVLDICFAADDNYAPYMGVALASVLSFKKADEFCRFHILDDGIGAENKQKLSSLQNYYSNFSVSYYPIDRATLSRFPVVNTHLSHTAYARLFMGSLLPTNISRLIYLDCDVFVRKSLYNLFSVDLGNNLLGGVEDFGVMNLARQNKHSWPWHEYSYINSGVLLVDLARWRKENAEQQLLAYLQNPPAPLQFEDQDAINFVFRKQIKILSCKWNGQMYWLTYAWNKYPEIKSTATCLTLVPWCIMPALLNHGCVIAVNIKLLWNIKFLWQKRRGKIVSKKFPHLPYAKEFLSIGLNIPFSF